MQPLTLSINAHRYDRGENHALLLDEDAPSCPVRLALVIRGTERHVFPGVVLDDWGREKKGPSLYRWLYEEGPRYPRAELFGYDAYGDQTQIFLRDLELSFRYPCYVYDHPDAPMASGERLQTIFLPGPPQQTEPVQADAPQTLPRPLQRAAVRWRQVAPEALQTKGWSRVLP